MDGRALPPNRFAGAPALPKRLPARLTRHRSRAAAHTRVRPFQAARPGTTSCNRQCDPRQLHEAPPGDPEPWTGGVFAARHAHSRRIARSERQTGVTLSLPEATQRLWHTLRNGDCEGLLAPHRPCFGGGTVLAARWHHRTSTNIDLFWPAGLWVPRERHEAIERWAGSLTPAPLSVLGGMGPVTKVMTGQGDVDFIESMFAESDTTRDRVEGTGLEALDTSQNPCRQALRARAGTAARPAGSAMRAPTGSRP